MEKHKRKHSARGFPPRFARTLLQQSAPLSGRRRNHQAGKTQKPSSMFKKKNNIKDSLKKLTTSDSASRLAPLRLLQHKPVPQDPRRSIPPPSDAATRPCNATERRERQSGESFSSDVPATWGGRGACCAVGTIGALEVPPPLPPPRTPHDPALAPASLMVGPGMWPLIGG